MKRKPITQGGQKLKNGELPEFKILADRILNHRDIKWIHTSIHIVQVEREGMAVGLSILQFEVCTQIKSVIGRQPKSIPITVVNPNLRKKRTRVVKFALCQGNRYATTIKPVCPASPSGSEFDLA